MADEYQTASNGVRGRLPALPRNALNPSVIAAEQAYRKRSGLPLLTEDDIAALKAGEPMLWERAAAGESVTAVATTAAPPAPPANGSSPESVVSATPVAPTVAAASMAGISPEVAKLLAAGKKWSKSSIAAEQARRKRNNLASLNDIEIAALLGEPAEAAPAAAAPVAVVGTAAAARPAAPAAAAMVASAAASVARSGEATTYVGTPAVGTSKAAKAGGVASVGPENSEVNQSRRLFAWSAVAAFLVAWFIAFFRFFLPRTLFEPSTTFKIGYPTEYGLGVDTKFQQKYRIWIDRTPDRLFVIYARCTHLGCTPDWKPAENKFKCPCHGSGYDSEGVNFEGPAPRPMDRAHIEIAPDGQILVNVAKLYQWPKGQPSQFNDGDGHTGAFLSV